jgi:hypothetical protein
MSSHNDSLQLAVLRLDLISSAENGSIIPTSPDRTAMDCP